MDFGLILNIAMIVGGVFLGWHFPQPLWVSVAITAIKTWFKNLRDK